MDKSKRTGKPPATVVDPPEVERPRKKLREKTGPSLFGEAGKVPF